MKGETYLFVDGAWLEMTRMEYQRKWFPMDQLTTSYRSLRRYPSVISTKAFYYDAFPEQKGRQSPEAFAAELTAAEARFRDIESNDGWHVNFGLSRAMKKSLRQKGVDVKLAIDAVTHRMRGNCDKVAIVTGDLDFLPLIRSLVELGAWVTLITDPMKAPLELCSAADERCYLTPLTPAFLGARPYPVTQCTAESLPDTEFDAVIDNPESGHILLFQRMPDGGGRCFHAYRGLQRIALHQIAFTSHSSFDLLTSYIEATYPGCSLKPGPFRFE
jgi:uncharacterized LabA/DUF88 family protein